MVTNKQTNEYNACENDYDYDSPAKTVSTIPISMRYLRGCLPVEKIVRGVDMVSERRALACGI